MNVTLPSGHRIVCSRRYAVVDCRAVTLQLFGAPVIVRRTESFSSALVAGDRIDRSGVEPVWIIDVKADPPVARKSAPASRWHDLDDLTT